VVAEVPRRVLGERLRAARRAAGLTLREVATQLGVSAGTWSAVENGRTRLSPERLRAASRLLGTDPARLLLTPDSTSRGVPESWRSFPPLDLPAPLAGALSAFVELGYAGATVRDVAERAGLSVPGLYHHWPTKQDLLVALLDLTMDDLRRRSRQARAEGDGPTQRFSLLVECLALFHAHRRELGFIGASEMRSVQEPARARITSARTEQQRMLDDEVLEGHRRGEFGTTLPREASRAVVTLCTALPQWWSPAGPASAEQVAEQYVSFALDLVRVRR
jgi:AcrR family transcriptional regulator/DNA-binding XRE family transcriptional regulator